MAWASEGPGPSKLTRFKKTKTTKPVKDGMMSISIESLSLKKDMVSEVRILRNSFYFP